MKSSQSSGLGLSLLVQRFPGSWLIRMGDFLVRVRTWCTPKPINHFGNYTLHLPKTIKEPCMMVCLFFCPCFYPWDPLIFEQIRSHQASHFHTRWLKYKQAWCRRWQPLWNEHTAFQPWFREWNSWLWSLAIVYRTKWFWGDPHRDSILWFPTCDFWFRQNHRTWRCWCDSILRVFWLSCRLWACVFFIISWWQQSRVSFSCVPWRWPNTCLWLLLRKYDSYSWKFLYSI